MEELESYVIFFFLFIPLVCLGIGLIVGVIVGFRNRRSARVVVWGLAGSVLGAIAGIALMLPLGRLAISGHARLFEPVSHIGLPRPTLFGMIFFLSFVTLGALIAAILESRRQLLSNHLPFRSFRERFIKQCTSCGTEYKDEYSCPECGHTSWIRGSDKNPT